MRYAAEILALTLLAAGTAAAQRPAPLRPEDGWARPVADTTRPSGGYLRLTNVSADTVVVTGARCAGVRRTEIHETSTADGMMRMRRIAELVVPPGATIMFQPGGLHLMLMMLEAPLVAGQTVACTLELRGGATVPVSLAVRAP